MLAHDVLFALLGFPGDLIVVDDRGQLVLVPSEAVKLETWDQAIVREILAVATLYMQLRHWVVEHEDSPKVYCQAAAICLEQQLLSDYEKWIGEYETKFIQSVPYLTNPFSLTTLRLDLQKNWTHKLLLVHGAVGNPDFPANVLLTAQPGLQFLQHALRTVLVRQLIGACKYGLEGQDWPQSVIDGKLWEQIEFCRKAAKFLRFKKIKTVPPGLSSPWNTATYLQAEIELIRQHQSLNLDRVIRPIFLKEFEKIRGLFLLGFGDLWTELIRNGSSCDLSSEWNVLCCDHSLPVIQFAPATPIDDLIVSEQQVGKYQEIFDFLFRVKRTITNLVAQSPRTPLTFKALHFFQSLFSFFQIDLIETEWNAFMLFVHASTDVQEIARKHSKLVTQIHTGCLLAVPDVRECIFQLEKICRDGEQNGEILFNNEMRSLFNILEDLQLTATYASINRLICKLDYNSFYRDRL